MTADDDERVRIRVPIRPLRRGVKLSKLIPGDAKGKISDALREKGFDFDIASLDSARVEALLESISDLRPGVEKDDRKFHILWD